MLDLELASQIHAAEFQPQSDHASLWHQSVFNVLASLCDAYNFSSAHHRGLGAGMRVSTSSFDWLPLSIESANLLASPRTCRVKQMPRAEVSPSSSSCPSYVWYIPVP